MIQQILEKSGRRHQNGREVNSSILKPPSGGFFVMQKRRPPNWRKTIGGVFKRLVYTIFFKK